MSFGSTNLLIDCAATAAFLTSSTDLWLACARPSNTFSVRAPPTAPGSMAFARIPCVGVGWLLLLKVLVTLAS